MSENQQRRLNLTRIAIVSLSTQNKKLPVIQIRVPVFAFCRNTVEKAACSRAPSYKNNTQGKANAGRARVSVGFKWQNDKSGSFTRLIAIFCYQRIDFD